VQHADAALGDRGRRAPVALPSTRQALHTDQAKRKVVHNGWNSPIALSLPPTQGQQHNQAGDESLGATAAWFRGPNHRVEIAAHSASGRVGAGTVPGCSGCSPTLSPNRDGFTRGVLRVPVPGCHRHPGSSQALMRKNVEGPGAQCPRAHVDPTHSSPKRAQIVAVPRSVLASASFSNDSALAQYAGPGRAWPKRGLLTCGALVWLRFFALQARVAGRPRDAGSGRVIAQLS